MPLQTANQFQLTPDLVGAASRGLQLGNQFRQSNQQAANQKLGTQQQAILDDLSSKAAAGDPQALTQLSGIAPDKAKQIQTFQATQQENRFKSVVRGAQEVQNIKDPIAKLALLKKRRAKLQSQGIDTSDTDEVIGLYASGDIAGGNSLIDRVVQSGVQSGFLTASAQPDPIKEREIALKERAQTFKELPKEEEQAPTIPPILLEGLSEGLALKASAAFTAAGGGKDGLASFQKVIDKGTEQERRLASPKLIQNSFPKANSAETVQLQAAMDAAKTTESGLKAAGKIREEQRRIVKVQGFQDRSIVLLDNILFARDDDGEFILDESGNRVEHPELADVLGSIEGTIDFRLQDSEAELIADIDEVGDILTADNLKLMSGVLSETDIQILRNLAGGGLKRTRTLKRFRSDVLAIRDEMIQKRVSRVGEQKTDTDEELKARLGI